VGGTGYGGAAASQVSGLLVTAGGLAVIVGMEWRAGPRRALAHAGLAALITWIVVWGSYAILDPAVLRQLPILVPRPYLDGIAYLASHDTSPAAGYIAGIAYTGGRWWFWPLSLVNKWPATGLLPLIAGAIACRWLAPAVRRRTVLAVAIPAIVLTGFTITMPRDIGLRYLLPVIALWAAAAGALVSAARSLGRTLQRVTGVALTVLLASAALVTADSFPGSLAWTAWPFRPAYAMVTDSNVDWGQGLYVLRSWSVGRHPWVAYFGPRGLGTAAAPGARSLLGTAPTALHSPGSVPTARSGFSPDRSSSITSGSLPRRRNRPRPGRPGSARAAGVQPSSSATPARGRTRLPDVSVAPGSPADLVAVRATDLGHAVASGTPDRIVLRGGRIVTRTPDSCRARLAGAPRDEVGMELTVSIRP
jgi:hypothetical protein